MIRSAKSEKIVSWEKEIALWISNSIKKNTGKGPSKIKVRICKDHIVAIMEGHCSPAEVALAQAGSQEVDALRRGYARAVFPELAKHVEEVTGLKVLHIFHDTKVSENISVTVMLIR